MSADVIILTGPPGAGKSTTARALAQSYARAAHLHTDDFWHYITSGAVPPYLPESDQQNHVVLQVIQKAAFTYAEGGFTTIVDGIVGPWMLSHFLGRDTGPNEPRLHYVVSRPAREETVRRAQGRTAPEALVDEDPILSLWDQFADLGPLERHVVDTTDHDPGTTLEAVARAISSNHFVLSSDATISSGSAH